MWLKAKNDALPSLLEVKAFPNCSIMVRLQSLKKAFHGRPALHDLSLEVPKGEIFGLLGHNGAGKSTTFGILLGQVFPDSGEAFIDGISVQRERGRALARVGAIFETPGFYDYMSGWENLRIFTSYTARVPTSELKAAVETVNLGARIHDPVRTYSHGMRQRLALAQALLPSPELILLDEPTEGLDPEGIHEIRELIRRLNSEYGLTVVLSSHLLAEVEQLCTRVAILNQGTLIFDGRWSELQPSQQRFRICVNDWSAAARLVEVAGGRILEEGLIELSAQDEAGDFVARLVHAGIRLSALEPQRASLEALYLEMIGASSARSPVSS